MKKSPIRSIFCFLLAAAMMLGITPFSVYASDQTVYINSSSESAGNINTMYASGGEGSTAPLTGEKVYAITDTGVCEVGTTPEVTSTPAVSSPAPTEAPTPTPTVSTAPSGPNYVDQPLAYSTVKVGLSYGSEAVDEATLTNTAGKGFLFGYYDSNRTFHEVGSTNASSITVISDWNWITKQGISIGCYHILKHNAYGSFEDAAAEAKQIGGFVGYHSGSYFVQKGHYWTPQDASNALTSSGINGKVFTASKNCIVVTQTGTDKILFEFDCGTSKSLAIRAIGNKEKTITRLGDLTYYGDFQFARLTGDQFMTVVNYVDIEDYTKGVIPYEVYASWPFETLKAQALCARNYVASNFNRYRAQGFDVTDDIYSQVYNGIGDATKETNAAVDATAGQFIRYEGEICQTFFFSSDGGATESSENVWGYTVPYLMGTEDPYEKDVKTYYESWSYTLTPKQVQEAVNKKESRSLGVISKIECTYTDLGNMKSIKFIDKNGNSHTISGDRCRVVMGANSLRFTIKKNSSGNFVISGSGWGHNCGMSQYGAYSMAKHHGKTAEEIINFYFSGVYIR